MTPRKPCTVCAAYGTRTMTSARSSWTVEGGVRIACPERPVCRACERQAAHYPTEGEARTLAAALLGRKGGSVRSQAKAAAVRANGCRGGRPVRLGTIETEAGRAVVRYAPGRGRVECVLPDGTVEVPEEASCGSLEEARSAAAAWYGRDRTWGWTPA